MRARKCRPMSGGKLVIRKPWPSMLRSHLGRQGALQEDLLERSARAVFCRRRRAPRQGWLLLDRGPHRRRAQRRRATASARRKWRARSSPTPPSPRPRSLGGPMNSRGRAVVCFVTVKQGVEAEPELRGRAEETCAHGHRPGGHAGRNPLRRGAAQDAQRQDHAPAAQGDRQRQGRHGRHDDAGGSQHPRAAQQPASDK